MVSAVEIFRLPAVDVQRRILDLVGRREPGTQRGEIYEELEGGARLARRLGGPIELAIAIAPATHHGYHRAARQHCYQRRLARVDSLALLCKHIRDYRFGKCLKLRNKRGLDLHR